MNVNDKKQLKQYINDNGFFLHINSLEKLNRNDIKSSGHILSNKSIKTNEKLPEGENILVFRGLATQNFAKGEVSRNNYKIDVSGWDFSHYVNNPQILLQHNADEPVGKCLEILPHSNGVDIVYFVNLDWMNEVDRNRMKGGAFSALSTGHITREVKYENKETGELLTEDEVHEKYGLDWWDLMWSDAWVLVVTNAEALEVSAVTLPSNPGALTVQNSLDTFFQNSMKTAKEKLEEANKLKKNEADAGEDKDKDTDTSGDDKPEGDGGETPEAGADGGENPPEDDGSSENDEPDTPPEDTPPEDASEEDKVAFYENKIKSIKESKSKPSMKNEMDSFKSSLNAAAELIEMQQNEIDVQRNDIDELKKTLDKIPVKEGLSCSNQFGEGVDESKETEDKEKEDAQEKKDSLLGRLISANKNS